MLRQEEFLVDVRSPELPIETICAVTLKVPKAVSHATNQSEPRWHRCLHQAYEGGFTRIGQPELSNPVLALGKIRSIDRSEPGDVRIEYWWWLVQLTQNPSRWVRGQLDENCLHLDGRMSQPDQGCSTPRGHLGPWLIQFFFALQGGWQYKAVGQTIDQANHCLPPELQIRTDWEGCNDPSRLINFYM